MWLCLNLHLYQSCVRAKNIAQRLLRDVGQFCKEFVLPSDIIVVLISSTDVPLPGHLYIPLSVGCCINREKGYLLPTWVWKITCQCFDWILQSSSGQKWKMCKQTLLFMAMHYWRYTSLRSKVGENCPPSLPPHHGKQQTQAAQTRDRRRRKHHCLCGWDEWDIRCACREV